MAKLTVRMALVVIAGLVLSAGAERARAAEKLTLEQVIAKHLESVAPAEARAGARARASEWNARFVIKMGGQGSGEGKGVLISEGRKLAFAMRFPVNEYPGEKFVFDGEKWETARRTTELRSGQANLVKDNSEILREGLFGGVLSTAWPLCELQSRQAKLKYDGMKKVDGVNLHRVSYTPRKSNNGMQIFLFFEPVTFRHVKTIYLLEIQPGQQAAPYGIGNVNSDGSPDTKYRPNTRYKLEEDFSDFKEAAGFTLPAKWRVRYTWEPASGQGTTVTDWELALTGVVQNGEVDPSSFALQTIAHPGGQ
jgi:hypothetical protein